MEGFVHSFESMGLVDGPGIRSVVFLQGCQLRCRYCHNPDTWAFSGGQRITPAALVERLMRFRTYYQSSGGGVTFSGGEPLQQPEFLLETLKLCKQADIHTCIDTAGIGKGDYAELLRYTDLVLYDVKHYTPEGYRMITGQPMDETLRFLQAVQNSETPLWIRHVVVPDLTDSEAHIRGLAAYLRTLRGVQKVELLPYHQLGVSKYHTMGIPYSLQDVPPMNPDALKKLQEIVDTCVGG